MELVRGRSLAEEVLHGPLGIDRSAGIVRQVLAALVYAHGEGVIHRDLKPNNVMLVEQPGITDLVKILDFGLAKFMSGEETNDVSITKEGSVFGTPAYMSPEQVAGEPTDERSDVYSVGLVLFECLAGRRPFDAETRADVMRAHLSTKPPRVGSFQTPEPMPPALERVVARALEKRPRDRFASAVEMLHALDEAVGAPLTSTSRGDSSRTGLGRPSTPLAATMRAASSRTLFRLSNRPIRMVLASAGVVALLAGGLLVWSGQAPRTPPRTGGPASAEAPATAAAPPSTRPPARDPWADPVPADLAQMREGLAKRGDSAIKTAKTWAREHSDPRAHLAIGHYYFEKRWLGDALDRYKIALDLDPTVRGDPELLPRLIAMLGADSTSNRRAAALIESVWRDEAAEPLARSAASHPNPAVAHAAIALLDRLGESARVDHVAVALTDLQREKRCPGRQAALARLRGRSDPRIAPALQSLAADADASRCLGDSLGAAIREVSPGSASPGRSPSR
jgi:hypothetical protein